MEIAKHTFFVTGANSGLGKATTRQLIKLNANVVGADLIINEAQQTASESLFIHMDVTNVESIEAALTTATERFGTIHGLVNCAGILVAERILKKDGSLFCLENFRRCLDVNLVGTFNMIRLMTRLLSNNTPNSNGECGIIINTSSIAAYEGQVGQVAYAASKAGINGMTLPLSRELADFGIRVMAIAPGIFSTPLLADMNITQSKNLEQQTPFPRRLGKPSDYAVLVQHIIENPMLNGEVIRLDGALRLTF
ncbi:MAG: SDR family NAD(P)-dependent oxidoreductase [Methylococcales bacterium]|jgi:NAD(P)-dependent dehydrogenase (short-subunit alcohol dehydrogenase family)|nr:SDR family NAD(P)-dependent oxidoreductase [Methylococcales bacterium]